MPIKSDGQIIGLGLNESDPPALQLKQAIDYLRSLPRSKINLAILGSGPWAKDLDHWAKQNLVKGTYLGHFKDNSLYNEDRFSYADLSMAAQFYRPPPQDTYYLICSPASDYRSVTRRLMPKLDFLGKIILPFLQEKIWENTDFDPHKPIVIHSVSRSGTLRFWPTFRQLLYFLGRDIQTVPELHRNQRAMSHYRQEPASKDKPKDLALRIRQNMLDSAMSFPGEKEQFQFHSSVLNLLDFYQARLLHMHVFVPLAPFLELPNIQWVAWMRDPRDVITSFYYAFVNKGYYFDHLVYASDFPEKHKEELLMDLIRQGWRYLNFHNAIACPDIKKLAQHYVLCQKDPRVRAVKFEDVHSQPEVTYFKLLDDLKLLDQPYYKISPSQFKKALEVSTFDYQTKGARLRGQEMSPDQINYGSHRLGLVGDWKNHFTPRIKELVKELIGPELISLGYETDLNW